MEAENQRNSSTTQIHSEIKTINIVKDERFGGFGFNIVGGTDAPHIPKHTGIFISKIRRNDLNGAINEGDRIISVNGTSLDDKTHSEVVKILTELNGEVIFIIETNAEEKIISGHYNDDQSVLGSTTMSNSYFDIASISSLRRGLNYTQSIDSLPSSNVSSVSSQSSMRTKSSCASTITYSSILNNTVIKDNWRIEEGDDTSIISSANPHSTFPGYPSQDAPKNNNIYSRSDSYKMHINILRLDSILQRSTLSAEEVEKHSWNPEDRSINIYVKEEDRLTIHRHPVALSTDAIRGKIGYSHGFHVWRLVWPMNQRGTNAVIGVATKNAQLQITGYQSLIGLDNESYGWDIVGNKCFHDSKYTTGRTYPSAQIIKNIVEPFQVPETILCVLDMDEGQLSFATESIFLGVAFTGLKGKKLYPVVSAVWGHCEITLKYVGGMDSEPRQLMDICRSSIRLHMDKSRSEHIQELNLPLNLKNYLLDKYNQLQPNKNLC